MAKSNRSIVYKNCDVSLSDMMITEILKDSSEEFSIMDIFKLWDGESGVDITFKKSSEITADGEIDADEGEE